MIEAALALALNIMVAAAMVVIAAMLIVVGLARFVWQVFCLPARLFSRAQSR
jgi:ABC-type proline/glycine betaine transport system permease subunit